MSKSARLLGLLTVACALPVWAAQVPVSDARNTGYSSAGYASPGMSQGQGELFMQLQQLQEEVSRLRGTLEEQQYEIQRLKQEGLERYQDLDSRLSRQPAPMAPAVAASGSAAAVPPAAALPPQQTAPAAAAANAAPADPAKEKLFYDAAFDLIKARDFAKADLAFTAFLRKYPRSQYAGNAQYWLGEVKLAQKDFAGANQAFTSASHDYPDNPKVPDALYKLGDVERQQGNKEKARALFQQVIRAYPNSSAAKLAQRSLEQI